MFNKCRVFAVVGSLLIAMAVGGAAFSISSIPIRVNAEENKAIYVDVSLNEIVMDNGYKPYLCVDCQEPYDIPMSLVKDDIYVTDFGVPVELLSNIECSLSVGFLDSDGLTSIYIDGKGELSSYKYNYIYLSNEFSDDKIGIEAFGFYGEKGTKNEATYKTQRIWLNNDGHNGFLNANWAIGYFSDGRWNIQVMSEIINSVDNSAYLYADVPFELTTINFLAMSDVPLHDYAVYLDVPAPILSYGVCYVLNQSNDVYSVSTDSVNGATAFMIGLVVESYLTYGDAPSNGAVTLTIQNVFSTWFENKSATTDELKSTKILDYTGYAANGYSYVGLEKKSSFSVNEKWDSVCNKAGVDPNTGKLRTPFLNFSGSPFLIGAVSLGLVTLLVVFAFASRHLKRKS